MTSPATENHVTSPEELRQRIEERRQELLAKREARNLEATDRQRAHELACLELEDRFVAQLGVRGVEWELVNEDNACEEGPIVLKRATALKHKIWSSKPGATPEDIWAYVKDSILYPAGPEAAAMLTDRRPELLGRCAAALIKLAGFTDQALRGK
jgi:hypothetical protein